MFNFFKKKPEKTKEPQSRSQVDLCKRLGLEITPQMGREEVSTLLSVSLKKEKYIKIYDEIQKEQNDKFEKEDRDEYGDEIVDELKEWEKYCNVDKQYILIFKRGSNIKCEIVEFESAEIVGDKKYSIQLSILFPKVYKDKDTGNYLEWEKEVNLKPKQVYKIEELNKTIDMFDLEEYESILNKYKTIANEFKA